MWVPFPGMPVLIDKIGTGKIIKVLGKSALVSIDKYNGIQIEKPLSSLNPIREHLCNKTEEKKGFSIKREVYLNNATKKNLEIRTIESLRFGLVPDKHIEELTLGYNELKQWVERGFVKCALGNPTGFEVSGTYGTGKSHTLSIIRYLAEKKGFLTAKAEVDGNNLSFSNPEVLLNHLWGYLTGNNLDSEFPLLYLYTKIINRGIIPSKIITEGNDKIKNNLTTIYNVLRSGHLDKYSEYINAIISSSEEYTATQVVKEISSEFNISKSQIKLERMISRKLDCKPMDFIESIAGHAIIAKLAGYKGLIITIDEFEIEYMDKKRFDKAENVLRALYKYFKGYTKYFKAPVGIYIAAIDQGGLKGDRAIENYVAMEEEDRYRLRVWDSDSRINLAKKIHRLYCEAYSLDKEFDVNLAKNVENMLARKIENNDSGLIRSFIKWYIGILDIKYGPPEGVV